VEGNKVQPIAGRYGEYRLLTTDFLKALQAALYFSGGQPPRGDNDLWALQYRNHVLHGRNLMYYDSSLIYVSSVNKTIWKYGRDAGIPHIFPWDNPSKILLQYLLFFRPLEIALASRNRGNCPADCVERMKYFVFQDFNKALGTADFTIQMREKTQTLLELHHEGLRMGDTRQCCVYVGKNYILPAMRDPDNGFGAILDLQSGHSPAIGEALYGVEIKAVPFSVQSNTYLSFKITCYSHHHFYEIADHHDCKLNLP
jgi:hypothetical protein